MTLPIGTYELDGFVFAEAPDTGAYVLLESGDHSEGAAVRHQDKARPRTDSWAFGRDLYSPPVRTFVIGIKSDDPLALPRLRNAWRADAVRSTPGASSVLRWNIDGETYRASGRPRDFEVLGKKAHDASWTVVRATFLYRDLYVLRDEQQSVSLTINAPSTGSGIILPKTLPWTLGEVAEKAGVLDLDAISPTPFTVTITGPSYGSASQLKVWGAGWSFDFGGLVLSAGQVIKADTYAATATRNGVNVAGNLSIRSTLSGRLQPGINEFRFSCSDPSGTTTASVKWRDSLQLF